MNTYRVSLTYTMTGDGTAHTFETRRRAATAGSAISTVTALFNALSNYRNADGSNYLNVMSCSALQIVETTNTNSTNNETEGE